MTAWTSDMDAILIANWRELCTKAIAELIGGGVTKNCIIGRAHRIGLPPKKAIPRPRPVPKPRPRLLRIRPQMAPIMPVVEIKDVEQEPIPFMQLESWHCREIVGRGDDGLSLSCGRQQSLGSPYCPRHTRKNYSPERSRSP